MTLPPGGRSAAAGICTSQHISRSSDPDPESKCPHLARTKQMAVLYFCSAPYQHTSLVQSTLTILTQVQESSQPRTTLSSRCLGLQHGNTALHHTLCSITRRHSPSVSRVGGASAPPAAPPAPAVQGPRAALGLMHCQGLMGCMQAEKPIL